MWRQNSVSTFLNLFPIIRKQHLESQNRIKLHETISHSTRGKCDDRNKKQKRRTLFLIKL